MEKEFSIKVEEENIKKMYQKIKQLIQKNNEIVDKIWKIEHVISSETKEDKSALLILKEKLKEEIESNHFQEKIQSLQEQVYELEMKIYGESNILSNSPHVLRF